MTKKPKINPLVLYRRENTEIANNISNIKKSFDDKDKTAKLRKNKLNIINSQNSNLPSTIFDSKIKDKEKGKVRIINKNINIKPKSTNNRHYIKIDKIKSKGKEKKINIEIDNNIKYLKKNLNVNTEGDIVENKITNIKIAKEINSNQTNANDITEKNKKIIQPLTITNINTSNNINKIQENIKTEKKMSTLKKKSKKKYNINTDINSKHNISSFDKRKKYIVPIVKHKKKKKLEKRKEKKKDIESEKNILEIKEILASNLIKNKQIEYLRDYQKYIDDYNNKIYKNNEKKFNYIREEGLEIDDLFSDDDENKNYTIHEINEKEEGEEVQESL